MPAAPGTSNIYGVTNDPCRIRDFAWYKDTSEIGTSAVAKKKANPWGLYDMLGNVNEWVYDFYSPAAYKEDSQQETTINPKGPKTGRYTSPAAAPTAVQLKKYVVLQEIMKRNFGVGATPRYPRAFGGCPQWTS